MLKSLNNFSLYYARKSPMLIARKRTVLERMNLKFLTKKWTFYDAEKLSCIIMVPNLFIMTLTSKIATKDKEPV